MSWIWASLEWPLLCFPDKVTFWFQSQHLPFCLHSHQSLLCLVSFFLGVWNLGHIVEQVNNTHSRKYLKFQISSTTPGTQYLKVNLGSDLTPLPQPNC